MYRLSWIVFLLSHSLLTLAQSPHGNLLMEDCNECHNSYSWLINMDTFNYDHSNKNFDLEGIHFQINCKNCHSSLIFSKLGSDCISCHEDQHQMSVGIDCARCHTFNNWLVDDIPILHEMNGFPLVGSHFGIDCIECHQSESNLIFNPLGNDCKNCHIEDYNNTQSPNHASSGFSTNCVICHDPISSGNWETTSHFFFPLTLGHDIQDCSACHKNDIYSGLNSDCFSCHEEDFKSAETPNHELSLFSIDCLQCHTTDLEWKPAEFKLHDDQYFPIYSGKHEGEWNKCQDCHTNFNDYSIFSCINCHEHNDPNDLADEHEGIKEYRYESAQCLKCHPNGDE